MESVPSSRRPNGDGDLTWNRKRCVGGFECEYAVRAGFRSFIVCDRRGQKKKKNARFCCSFFKKTCVFFFFLAENYLLGEQLAKWHGILLHGLWQRRLSVRETFFYPYTWIEGRFRVNARLRTDLQKTRRWLKKKKNLQAPPNILEFCSIFAFVPARLTESWTDWYESKRWGRGVVFRLGDITIKY